MKNSIVEKKDIVKEINRLKKEKKAIILAHYYVDPDVQDIADYIGDSLGLSQMAGKTDAQTILFCGVNFMAETASIISPSKKVLVPDNTAGCSLAESVEPKDIIEWKKKNPNGVVVSYVNTTAEIKAHTDICCTSANAAKVIMSIPSNKKILFGPDKNLGNYIKLITERDIDIWDGDCVVHKDFSTQLVEKMIIEHPEADILIHPESSCSHDPSIYGRENAYVLSTSGMIKRAGDSTANSFIVVTEPGVIHQMELMYPNKHFIPIDSTKKCFEMRKVTLEKVLWSLQNNAFEVKVPEEIRVKAYPSIQRMLEIIE
ncbi:MAG: quinolinate synthase NadA [Bacteroidales bacterium]|nr:quinolinate synthase NadA [Bacteroidales bacterium]MDD4656670.1 quinolinate synthase NadA [Bacteroidales bacterium]